MAVEVAHGVEGVQELVGRTVGPGDWAELTPAQVEDFVASAGPSEQPPGTVPPYLLLSLVSRLAPGLLQTTGFAMGVNYGCDQVRFPGVAPVGARLRASLTLDRADAIEGGVALWTVVTIEAEGVDEPVLVATTLSRRYL